MPCHVDVRSLLGKLHRHDLFHPLTEQAADRPAAGANLQTGRILLKRIPVQDVLADSGKMVKYRKRNILHTLVIALCFDDLQYFLFNISVGVKILSAVIIQIKLCHNSPRFRIVLLLNSYRNNRRYCGLRSPSGCIHHTICEIPQTLRCGNRYIQEKSDILRPADPVSA